MKNPHPVPGLPLPAKQALSTLVIAAMIWTSGPASVSAADFYWDPDATVTGNVIDGTNLGGTGTWDTSTLNWWDGSAMVAWPNLGTSNAIFTYAFPTVGLPTPFAVTVDAGGVTANRLSFFRSGYSLSGGAITLSGANAGLFAQMGETATISSPISGTAGLIKTGGGWIRLSNNANTYTGTTTLNNGSLVITNQGALGASTDAVVVTRLNPATTSTTTRGFGGGSLVLDGTGGNINFTRDLILHGYGPWSDRGAALVSTGINTLSGTVEMGGLTNGANVSTRITAADGTLNLAGTLNVQGTAATTISTLGGVNQAGASFYNVTGVLAGTGTLEGSGGGTLFLNPSDSSGFSGTIRVSGSAASGQSVVRIDSAGVLGTRTSGTTGAVLDLNGGVLAVLMDTPDVKVSNGTNANVYFRAASTIFADHTPNSSVKDQTVAFGNMSYEDNIVLTFNSRNGYGMSFTTAPVNGGDANTTLTNNLQGGALLSFTGNFWSNANNTGIRTMTIGGNGNTLINGGIIASAAAFDHVLTKTGTGTLTLTGTTSTLDGAVNVNGGTVAINDWRAITNNTSNVNIGTTTTGATLSVVGNNVSLTNLTTSKVINLSGTTGPATILANQTGTSPGVVFNAAFTATGAGIKTLTLGGANIGANTINGAIVNNSGTNTTALTKIDAGRWILAGTNTYTGATTISNGTLQLKANDAASTILADTSAITFNATNVYAGGTLELVGQASTNNVETLGVLTPTNGSGTIKLTPGSGGTASIVFASLGTVGGGGTVNIVAPTAGDTVKFTTTAIVNNIANAGLYYNGSDFAFVPGAATALRAPIYGDGLGGGGSDTDFVTGASALTAGMSNEITGSFSNGALAIDSLKINGAHTLTLTGALTIRTGAVAAASGGIIQTGGSGTITGAFSVGTNNAAALVVNVDGGANSLTLESTIIGTGGFTKVGAGTLRLDAANNQTGTISINEGTVRLTGSGRLGAASAALTIRQDGILELNGITPATTTGAFNNNGIVRNTSATTDVTFTVGGGNGTGTSNGIIEDGGVGKISVVKLGTGAQSWLGLSTYTGTTTIDSTGIVSINNLQNGGMASGIGASSNAAGNLIFTGASATQAYGGLSYTGTTNDETDRLFTFGGTAANSGARIQSNGVNGATSTWTNTGTLAFGTVDIAQGLVFGGASTGDNRFFPVITDNGTGVVSVYKADAGVWYLEGTNTYTGATTIRGGALYVNTGTSLPTASNLVLDGGSIARTGAFTRTLGTGANQVQWTAHAAGGFSAGGSSLTVDWGSGAVWGTGPFLGTGALLLNNSGVAKSDVDVVSGFEITQGAAHAFNATTTAGSATVNLTSGTTAGMAIGQEVTGNANIPAGRTIATIVSATQFTLNSGTSVVAATGAATSAIAGGYRQVNVGDFTSIGADFGTISGVITGAGSLAKEGTGILNLRGANTYTGQTLVRAGTLVVETLGLSTSSGATSVGDSTLGNTNAGAITLGNGTTTGGILEYVGLGETSDRKIRLNTTTGTNQIHADGVGALILTNVANDMTAGAKTLSLRGVSSAANFITSQLSDNGGTLGISIDGSTAWILTNPLNNYTGTTSNGAGALGIGDNGALGAGNLDLSNGSVFAYGADRTIANTVRLVNNFTTAIIGDYSFTTSNPFQLLAAANNVALINNVVDGKSVTFTGMTANAGLTGNRVFTVDGSGETNINGDFTTSSTAFGVNLTKTGNGVLILGGTGGNVNNFNQNNATIDIDRGTVRLGASEVIGHGLDSQAVPVAYGSVTLSPELAGGDTATLDLNGKTETINGLTMNTDGTAIIDNTSASAASLIFGANNSAVSIGGGTGVYTIQNSGGGALSITKTGTAASVIPTGVTLAYTGTTGVSGGSLTIASAINGTTGLSVTNSGSTLALTGGITTPSAITSVIVENGGTLSLLDGAGSQFSMLTNLQLGSSGGTMTTLNLNVGDITNPDMLATDTFTLLTGGTLSLFAGNQITFNLTDAGLNGNSIYNLIDVTDGGLTLGALGLGDWILGATPGGFASVTLNKTDTLISISTGNLITGNLFWRGLAGGGTDDTWNAGLANWSKDKANTIAADTIPGQGTDVVFAIDSSSGAYSTTLEQNFKINSLTFEAGASTPTSVTIAPGAVATNRIEIAPQSSSDGIKITAGGPAAATISGPVRLGGLATSQTWEVADTGSTLSLGSLLGERDVTKTGLGKVTLTAAADPTFNSGVTADFTINAGTLELTNSAALGNTINSNLATVTVNSTGAFYYNAAAGTVTNNLILGGGTLSAGTGNQTYSGTVNVSGNSFINMADSNGPAANAARNITLSGVVSGAGSLTIDSNSGVSSGNQLNGTLTLNNAANSWTGDLSFYEGTVTITNVASPSFTTNDVTFNTFGRFNLQGLNGATLTRTGTLTYGAGAIGEIGVDNTGAVVNTDFVVDQNGAVTLGSGGTGASVRVFLADANSKLNINGAVTLGGNSSISVGSAATRLLTISSVIGDGGSGYGLAINDDAGGWGVTNGTVRLIGANTFSGNVSLDSGTLEFDTVTGISGAASSLGQGTAINVTNSATLSFIGTSAQTTNRPINSSAGVLTLSANGTGSGTEIDYTGAITVTNTADGSNLILSGTAGSEGVISGGFTQTGDSADMTVNGGTWTHQTGTSRVASLMVVTGTSTILNLNSGLLQVRDDFTVTLDATLNLNGTGVLSFNTPTLTSGTLRATAGGVINLGANNAVVATEFDELRIGTDAAGVGTFDMNSFNQTVTAFILGNRNLDRSGLVDGTGTLTVTGNFDIYGGTVNANLASTGTEAMDKLSSNTVTLKGDNSGLTSTGDTIVADGILNLDYTVSNTTKINAAQPLDMRGARVNLIGNDSGPTTQGAAGLLLATGGSSTIQVTGGAGQEAVLNLGGITRGNLAQDGTIRFILPVGTQSATNGITTTSPNSTFGMLGTGATVTSDAAYATVEDGTGTWFATASGGNVVALASTAKNDVTTWLSGEHITDETTGFTSTLQNAFINSLRFDAAGGSDVVMSDIGVLIIGSGGFLITSSVGGTPSMMNGTLASGATELVITQDSSQTFEIGSDIRISHGVTKTGTGTLRLTGNNVYTGATEIQEGTLQVTGNSIGDTSLVTLANSRHSSLELLASETIGRLSGGGRNTDGDYGIVDVSSHTLTINNSGANTTFAGFFTGDGTIIKQGTHNLNLSNLSTGFTGILTAEAGMLQMNGVGQINAGIIRINKGGAMIFDNNGTTRSGTRILDTAGITLNSADGTFNGQTIVRGLAIRTDQDTTLDETVGLITLNTGASYVGMEATTANDDSDIIATNILRLNSSTLNVRGTNLGGASAQENEFRIGDATNQTAFIANAANLVGGGGAAASQNISIVPWAIGESTTGALAATHMGNSLVTYVSGSGFRPLAFTEYNTFGTQVLATDNIRESLAAPLALASGPARTMNALVLHNASLAAATHAVTGAGVGESLAVTSGALLFTLNPAAVAGDYGITLGGFDSGITVGATNEYVIHVVNPDAGAPTKALTATISSPLASSADITKSGRGTLILSGLNTAGGGANKTTINEGILEIADLDNIGGNTGALVFAGGTLRLGAGLTDDISVRTITLLDGGGTIDTNGIDLAIANSVGSGLGGLTKAGLGNLTLNAAANYTGATTITSGTLTVGANNATGNGGALNVGAGATLALGTTSIAHGLVTTSGASPLITGTGTISASTGFFFNHTGDTQIDAILAGAGGLLKAQANILTLTGLSTYTGTTEIQAGTLSINSISNVSGGASALGNAANAEDGIIRMGLTTAATTLNYTGSGHTSDRLIGMQGTTGGVTLDADGTGALGLGGARFEMAGNKTLTLRGSSDAALDNSIGALTEVGGILTLNKTDTNTWVVNGASEYTGVTQVDNGTLKIGVTNALPVGTAVRLGTGATAGTLDLNGFNQTIGSLTVQSTSNSVTNQIIVDTGNTLTINGAVTMGSTAEDSITAVNASGGGAIVVNSGGLNFQVGGATGTANNQTTADFSGLTSFTANLGAGTFRLGDANTDTEANPSTFRLATNNTITAANFRIGDGSGAGSLHTLTLGSGSNSINADTINVGSAGANVRSSGAMGFDAGDTTGSVTIRASDGTSRATINMVNTTGNTATDISSTIDLSGHTADILASTLTMASRTQAGNAATATLSFDQGSLDVTTLTMASRTGTGTGNATATVNLGDSAAPGTPTVTIGTINMAVNTSAGGTVLANLNISGGNVNIGDGLNTGTAINLANAGTGRTVTSNLNLTGGTVTVTGNIIRTGGAGTENETLTLDGSTLDMSGNEIGSAGTNINFAAESGTLIGLGELNGGGNFEKTTIGTLIMGNGNTYTGDTLASGGTLLANNTTGSATSGGAVTVQTGATLGGTGSIGGNTTIQNGGTLTAATNGTIDSYNVGAAGEGLVFDQNLTAAAGSTWLVDLSHASDTADFVQILGNLDLGGTGGAILALNLLDPWQNGDYFRIAQYVGTLSGTFQFNAANLADGGQFEFGSGTNRFYQINYADDGFGGPGNFITLTAVPEPSTVITLILLLALGLWMGRNRLRRIAPEPVVD